MMVANSSNMIITVKPANQNNNIRRVGPSAVPVRSYAVGGNGSQNSSDSYRSALSRESLDAALVENDEEDEVTEHVNTLTSSLSVYEDRKAEARYTQDPQSLYDKDQHATSDMSAKKKSDEMNQSGLPADFSRVMPGIAGNSSIRSSGASSRSSRINENAYGEAYEYSYDEAILGNHSKTKDTGDERGMMKAANNNEVKPTSGVKVIFTPVEDL